MRRGDPGFSDSKLLIKIMNPQDNPHVCGDFKGYDNPAYPPLTAAPGEFLSLLYAENGHVSFPDATPRGYRSGNVMIYGSTEPIASMDIGINDILYQWTPDGTGGNQVGKLLASHFFDDGQCYEPQGPTISDIREERESQYAHKSMYCQSAVQLPSDLEISSTYSLIFVWDWPQNPNEANEVPEIYTSCMTISVEENPEAATSAEEIIFPEAYDAIEAAIPSQVSNLIEVERRGTGTADPNSLAAPTEVLGFSPPPAETTPANAATSLSYEMAWLSVMIVAGFAFLF
jgi:hypothetical protein